MKKRFVYPSYFSTMKEYTAHSGQIVEVIRRLTLKEADSDAGPMFLVRAEDGWEGHAYEDELEDVKEGH